MTYHTLVKYVILVSIDVMFHFRDVLCFCIVFFGHDLSLNLDALSWCISHDLSRSVMFSGGCVVTRLVLSHWYIGISCREHCAVFDNG